MKGWAGASCSGPEALVPGALRGYRAWGLEQPWNKVKSPVGLYGVSSDTAWTMVLTAKCDRSVCTCDDCWLRWTNDRHPDGIDSPSKNCECGIYGYYTPNYLSDMSPLFGAVGVVEVWGRILMGTKGFRAQHARIVAVAPYIDPGESFFHGTSFRERWGREVVPLLEYHDIPVYDDYHLLFEAFPPEDVSGLLGNDSAA